MERVSATCSKIVHNVSMEQRGSSPDFEVVSIVCRKSWTLDWHNSMTMQISVFWRPKGGLVSTEIRLTVPFGAAEFAKRVIAISWHELYSRWRTFNATWEPVRQSMALYTGVSLSRTATIP